MFNKQRAKRLLALSAAVAGIGSLMPSHAQAVVATLTWDASGSSASSPTDGGGNWNATGGTNWSTGSADGAWSVSDIASIGNGGTAGTITLGNVTASGIVFNALTSSGYTLTSGTITLSGTVVPLNNAVINSVIAGSGFTISGSDTLTLGTITLGASNSFTGTFQMGNTSQYANVILNNVNALADITKFTDDGVGGGGGQSSTLSLYSDASAAFNIGSSISVSGNTAFNVDNANGGKNSDTTSGKTLSVGEISAGSTGNTVFFINGDSYNLVVGTLAVGGTGNFANNMTGGTLSIGTLTLAANKTATFDGTGTTAIGAINPAGSTVSGITESSGVLILNGSNQYGGTTSISGGRLILAAGSSLGNTSVTVASGATLSVQSGSGNIAVGSTGQLILKTGSHFDMVDNAIGTFSLGSGSSGTSLFATASNLAFELNSSGVDEIVDSGNASVASTNTITIDALGSSLATANTYTLISAAGGLSSAFVFSNTLTTESLTVGGRAYTLSLLSPGATAEELSVLAGPAGNQSSLSLGTASLSYNTHLGVAGPGVSTYITNSTTTGDVGSYSLATAGSVATFSLSSTGTLAALSSTAVNLGWANVSSAGARIDTLTLRNTANTFDASTPTATVISGGVYNYATASIASPTVMLASSFVGGTVSAATITLSNSSPAAYSESLDAGITSTTSGVSGGLTGIGSVSLLSAGGATSTALSVGLNTATAGLHAGSVSLSLTSDGSTTSGLGLTSLTGQTVTVSVTGGEVWNHASLSVSSPTLNITLTQGASGHATYTLANATGPYGDTASISSVSISNSGITDPPPSSLASGMTATDTVNVTSSVSDPVPSGTITFVYGDSQTGLSNANPNNSQFTTLTVNAIVDPIVEHVNSTTSIDSARALIGTASPTYLGVAGQYGLGVLNQANINGGNGAQEGTVAINVLPSGSAAMPASILLFDFGSSYTSTEFSSLTSDLSAFGYTYSTNTNAGALGYFDHNSFQPTSYTYELSVTIAPDPVTANPSYVDFNFSQYGLTVDNFAAVPEPTTAGLLGAVGIGLLSHCRRRPAPEEKKRG